MPDIVIEGPDGGFGAYLALPATTPAPGILVAQEIFGVNAVMRDVCDWLAGAGYAACCPDVFWRIEPGIQLTDKTQAEWARAFELFGLFDVDKGIEDLKTALAHLRGDDACSGKVGSVGYCLGGKLAYLMAARSDAAALGAVDSIAQEKIKAGLSGNDRVSLHLYEDQDHAFARIGGEHYDKAAADLANQRSLDFFKEHLS